MGNCCGYLRVATNVTVSDPAMLEAIKSKCEIEVKHQDRHAVHVEPCIDPPHRGSSNNNSSSQENIEKHGTTCPKEDTNNKEDTIVIKKVHEKLNLEINIVKEEKVDDDSPSKKKLANSLNPGLAAPHRRDSRSTTSINNAKNSKKPEVEAEKKIDINELKLSGRLIERLEKFQALGGRRKNREATRVFLRSMTMGGEGLSELVEMEEKAEEEEKEDDKTKEEITKELKENKETIERNHRKITLIQQQEDVKKHFAGTGENSGGVKKKKVGLPKKKAAEEPVPGKSLLKKYRTIDDKRKKKGKKVKFQDLVDKKKKKKSPQNKF